MHATTPPPELMWLAATGLEHPAEIERTPLEDRGLPESTYHALVRAAELWPDRPAISLPARRRALGAARDAHVRRARRRRPPGGVGARRPGRRPPRRRRDPVGQLHRADHRAPRRRGGRDRGADQPGAGRRARSRARAPLGSAGDRRRRPGARRARLVARPRGSPPRPAPARSSRCGRPRPDSPRRSSSRGGRDRRLSRRARASNAGGRLEGAPPRARRPRELPAHGRDDRHPEARARTHRNEVANAWMVALAIGDDESGAVLAALPLFHTNALIVTLLAPLLRGRHVVWAGPLGYREPSLLGAFWKIVERYRIAAMSAVPTVYGVLAQRPVDADIASLRMPIVGAAPLPAALADAFRARTGVALCEGYGLTEATCASAVSPPARARPGRSAADALPGHPGRADRRGARRVGASSRTARSGRSSSRAPTCSRATSCRRAGRPAARAAAEGPRRLAGHRRPRLDRRRRLRPAHGPGQGPHHPRRAQHRPAGDRGRAARAPGRRRGRRRRPAGPARRRGAGRVRHARRRHRRHRGRAARVGGGARSRSRPPRRSASTSSTPSRSRPSARSSSPSCGAWRRRPPPATRSPGSRRTSRPGSPTDRSS